MSAEENMALARRFMEARVVKRDLNAVDEMLAPNFINHDKLVPGQEPDREDYLRGIAAFSLPSTSRQERLGETSTTSTSFLMASWASWWGMPPARGCQRPL